MFLDSNSGKILLWNNFFVMFSMCVIFFPLLKAYDMIMNKLDKQIVTQVARISVVLKCSFSITLFSI